jgi:hypothetical protein
MSSLFRNLLFVVLTGITYLPVTGQSIPEENRQCLRCHTSQSFTIHNEWTGMDEKRLMNPFYIIDTIQLASGVHHNFKCTDCHSMDYETYPHNGELKLEPLSTCIDCHGGDETYASFQFDRIEEEFKKSVHYEIYQDNFSCSKCHSQHYYKATARTSDNLKEIVEYSNNMCLSCHNNMIEYQLLSDSINPQLVKIHEWLPNQELHFASVRCIECHTVVQDSLMVSHNVMHKENATKNCVECHSSNSLLQASLYKYQNLSSRTEDGKITDILSNQHYVIGAYQSRTLNIILLIVLVATLSGIIIHSIFRIIKK